MSSLHHRFDAHVLTTATLLAVLIAPAVAEQTAERFEETVTVVHGLDYLLSVPDDYDAEGDPIPLVLFLHGAGERGDDLELVKVHGPPKMIEAGHKFPAIVVSPQCPEESFWTRHTEALIGLLDKIESQYKIDPDRVYVTGLSMGGYGSWRLAAAEPERFAAIIPVCGGGERWDAATLGKAGLPIWAFHGDHDFAVPLVDAVNLVNRVNREKTGRARLTVYPDTGHDSWNAAYDDPQTWEWLFSQKRELKEAEPEKKDENEKKREE